ncbi:family 43 glycosylhydrolase [Pelagicoccus sp. SDUM812005]|uniref:family 43 glycosylhydrolase n=1 Tax=Pelagicoccus sp. SDUM812005 TaxID=3041257 RepID=UPI00280CCBED|nr:family 43 glycosylhydrolase [Pelagicoccus sp. SDUM812005]MDQ8181673.1 family 43 glycosylhydrolase [Pelagicoccus sp. SDUM812005]
MNRFRSLLILFLVMASTLNLLSEEYPNPLVLQRADPWIHKHDDGFYYFIATAPQYLRIELRRAETIAGLASAEPFTIWNAHQSGPMGNHIWAPELHFLDGKWYIYFAAGDAEEKWRIRMYVLENDAANPLEGNWVEKGQVKTAWDDFSLDATVFENQGKRYYVWAQMDKEMGVNSNLYISEMENPWTLKGPYALLTTAEYSWETMKYKVNEGPAILKRNGKVFMTYSVNATDRNYRMGLLWASEDADLLDPASWTKSPGPVFQTSEDNGIYGPGHNGFTQDEEGDDILVYHARNYKDLEVFSLLDWNRHARVKPFTWTEGGFPDFGQPQPETPAKVASKPLFRDPIHDGAADPVVIWNELRGRWWMFYTNRRAKVEGLNGVQWVHGTHIGIAESTDQGATWKRYSQASIHGLPPELQVKDPTHWAPEVIRGPNGDYHMYLTFVPGVFDDWGHPRVIIHLTSQDLENWHYQSTLPLINEKVIDACVIQLGENHWRLWYNNELDGKSIYYADSFDLYHWEDQGKAVGDKAGEGPKVFRWKGFYWMVTDVWAGLGVYRSDDAIQWQRQSGDNLLEAPGNGADDGVIGGHPDVVVQGDRAFLFYFTHPGRAKASLPDGYETRRSSIQVVELRYEDGKLQADRDQETRIKLDPRFAP